MSHPTHLPLRGLAATFVAVALGGMLALGGGTVAHATDNYPGASCATDNYPGAARAATDNYPGHVHMWVAHR